MTSFIKFPYSKQVCFSSNDQSTVACFHKMVPWPEREYYFVCCGKRMVDSDPVTDGHTYHVVPRLHGGKGGFGSMLRAIGAQIEKTTSREACRDLSGRRMRDVNNEKKLREWVASKAEREREREERRKQRMERRRAVPNHCFNDPKYDNQKRTVVDNLDDALQEGLKHAGISGESRKRKSAEPGTSTSKKSRLGEGLVSDEMSDLELCSDYSYSDEQASPGPQPESSGSSQFREHNVSGSEIHGEPSVMSPVDNPSTSKQGNQESAGGDSAQGDAKKEMSADKNISVQDEFGSGTATEVPGTPSAGIVIEKTSGISAEVSGTDIDKASGTVIEKVSGSLTEKTSGSLTEKSSASLTEKTSASLREKTSDIHAEKTSDATTEATSKEQHKGGVEVDLLLYDDPKQLETLGLEVLKAALMARGLKCGGALTERATRLYSVKGLSHDQIKPSLFAKGGKVKGRGKN